MKERQIQKLEKRLNKINRKDYGADGKLHINRVSYIRCGNHVVWVEYQIILADGRQISFATDPKSSYDYIAGYVDHLLLGDHIRQQQLHDSDGNENEESDGDENEDPDGETWLNA